MDILKILSSGSEKEKKTLFQFSSSDDNETIRFRFNLWARYSQIQYFQSDDADFHKEIDLNNIKCYRGELSSFVDIAFRGAAKTSRTKLFLAYAILNDTEHYRRYIKILSANLSNAVQIVTDIYNVFVNPRVSALYPEVFEKTDYKKEKTMSAFTTATGVKLLADSVGTDQRGALQEDARPDLIIFEDIETRKTLYSAKTTRSIWSNMEEARTSLAKKGACIYNCNYISEQGNVHILVTKKTDKKVVMIVPIIRDDGTITWPARYTLAEIEQMKQDDDDFEGERLCKPSASKDILFDREKLDLMPTRQPIRSIAGFKIFREYNPSHRYASGHDVAGGLGLDSSTSVFIDFDMIPAQVVGTFANNNIKPEIFGHEVYKEADIFGACLIAIERNYGTETILKARQLGANLYMTRGNETRIDTPAPTQYGWHTNALTKPKMIFALAKAVEDGLLELNDEDLKQECKSYSRNDLLDKEEDPRLTTRHFDLLMACAIAWQMKDHATVARPKTVEYQPEPEVIYSDIGI